MTATLSDVPKQLAARPELDDLLTTFVDHWGMDHYDPPQQTISLVRQIIILAVAASKEQQLIDQQHS